MLFLSTRSCLLVAFLVQLSNTNTGTHLHLFCRPTQGAPGLPAAQLQPHQQSQQPAARSAAAAAPASSSWSQGTGEEEDDDLLDLVDVDQMVAEHMQRGGSRNTTQAAPARSGPVPTQPAPTQRLPTQAIPTQFRPQPGQQQQQQGPGSGFMRASQATQQQQPGVGAGTLCSHSVPYQHCQHRQQHLGELKEQLASLALQLATQFGNAQAAATQQQICELGRLKELLEQAPPAGAGGAGLAQGTGQQFGAPPPQVGAPGGTQHFQQQPYATQSGPSNPGGYGGGGGGMHDGFGGTQQQCGGWGGPGGGGGGPGGFAGTQQGAANQFGGGYDGGGGGGPGGGGGHDPYAREVAPMVPWQPDQEALRNVRAERVDVSHDKRWVFLLHVLLQGG